MPVAVGSLLLLLAWHWLIVPWIVMCNWKNKRQESINNNYNKIINNKNKNSNSNITMTIRMWTIIIILLLLPPLLLLLTTITTTATNNFLIISKHINELNRICMIPVKKTCIPHHHNDKWINMLMKSKTVKLYPVFNHKNVTA